MERESYQQDSRALCVYVLGYRGSTGIDISIDLTCVTVKMFSNLTFFTSHF